MCINQLGNHWGVFDTSAFCEITNIREEQTIVMGMSGDNIFYVSINTVISRLYVHETCRNGRYILVAFD